MSPIARTALVTGAARGIGRACAARLLADGYTVIAVDLAESEPILADNDGNSDSVVLTCDVADPTQVKALHAQVTAGFGRVDILVNNVGIFPACLLADLDYELFRHVMAVNVDSGFLMSAAFGPTMRDSGWGRIVNLGSSITHFHTRDLLPYITSKGAVHALTRAFDNELGGSGVTVNAIAPSFIQTEGVRSRTTDVDGMTTEEEQALLLSLQTIKRPQKPTDIANLLSFLVSNQADFITGQILHASGGLVRSGA